NKATQAKTFLEEAKKITKKKDAELSLQNIAKSDLMPEISATAFALKENEISAIITSPIGYHILFLSKINAASQISFSDAKDGIKENLIRAKQEKALNEKKADIEDDILAANSLDKVAKEFNFKLEKVEFDKNGNDLKGQEISKIKALENFVTNSFS